MIMYITIEYILSIVSAILGAVFTILCFSNDLTKPEKVIYPCLMFLFYMFSVYLYIKHMEREDENFEREMKLCKLLNYRDLKLIKKHKKVKK